MGKELSKRQLRLLFVYVLPYSFVIVGGFLSLMGTRDLLQAKKSVNWPCAEGKIVSSDIKKSTGDKGGTTYHADIVYKFSVANAVYDGTMVAYGDYGSSDSSHARSIVNRYPKNQTVTVYYMPDNPKRCVLEPGLKGQAWTVPILGAVFFIVGCAMAIGVPIAIKRPQVRHYWY